MDRELREWLNGLSEKEQEAERNGVGCIYSSTTDDIYFDITYLNLPKINDEELPFQ